MIPYIVIIKSNERQKSYSVYEKDAYHALKQAHAMWFKSKINISEKIISMEVF